MSISAKKSLILTIGYRKKIFQVSYIRYIRETGPVFDGSYTIELIFVGHQVILTKLF